jgi:hypothetical protein
MMFNDKEKPGISSTGLYHSSIPVIKLVGVCLQGDCSCFANSCFAQAFQLLG